MDREEQGSVGQAAAPVLSSIGWRSPAGAGPRRWSVSRPPDPGNRRQHACAGSHILDTPADARRGAIPAGLGRHPPQQAWAAADCRLRNRESVGRGDKPRGGRDAKAEGANRHLVWSRTA